MQYAPWYICLCNLQKVFRVQKGKIYRQPLTRYRGLEEEQILSPQPQLIEIRVRVHEVQESTIQ